MLHQLDLFGGEPVKIGDKPLPAHKRAAKKVPSEEAEVPKAVPPPAEISTPIPTPPAETTKKETTLKNNTASHEAILVGQPGVIAIPDDEILYSKQYYPISEVAKMFHVNVSLLRYWEKEFDIIKPRKNRKGDRLFRPEDIKNIRLIHFLLKEKKYTIKGAIHFLKNGKKIEEKFETIEILKKIRSMLVELKSGLS